jgi:Na+-transporting methylmalonyl-CoA/oxaloacetate decarboxylase gamma subunit
MKKVLKWVAIVFVGLIVLGLIVDSSKSPEEKAADAAAHEQEQAKQAVEKQEQAKQEMAALPAVTAASIASAYSENTVAADQQFKDKKFKVSGTVADINTDFMGNPYITLRGGVNQFMEPQFGFEKSDASQLANLKKGTKVNLICVGKGDVAKTPMSGSCTLL